MMRSRSFAVLFAWIGLFLLAGCQISLAGDVTPPPGLRSPSPMPQVTVQNGLPVVPPDPSQAVALYAEKCAPCHGTTGKGDGSQAAQMPNPVPPLGSADVARLAKPVTWFAVITQGKIDRMMPPFKSLTDRQRWDLVAYLYTLSTPAKVLETGKAVFEENCQACHGAKGYGDGSKAATLTAKVPDWRDLSRMAQRSPKDLISVVNTGSTTGMPAFVNQLSEDLRWAAVAYIRSLSFASNPGAPSINPTAVPTSTTPVATLAVPLTRITLAGKVTHSAGKPLPEGLKVTLQGYDNMQSTWQVIADVKEGSFEIKDVEIKTDRVFIATVTYQKVVYASDAIHAADLGSTPVVDVPIEVSDSSTDASVLTASRVHIFLDFTLPGRIQIAELYVITNPTDNAIVPANPNQPTLLFDLPAGYANLQFQDGVLGERFLQTEKGFGDLMEILPSTTHQVLFGFDLPYDNKKAAYNISFTLPVDTVVLMAPADGISVESSNLVSSGTRQMDNAKINLFTGSGFKKDSTLNLAVTGQPTPEGITTANPNSTSGLLIGIGVFGVALIIAGVWLFRQKQSQKVEMDDEQENEPVEDEDALLDAIVALDDLHQAGQLADTAYAERRAVLKTRLKTLKN